MTEQFALTEDLTAAAPPTATLVETWQ